MCVRFAIALDTHDLVLALFPLDFSVSTTPGLLLLFLSNTACPTLFTFGTVKVWTAQGARESQAISKCRHRAFSGVTPGGVKTQLALTAAHQSRLFPSMCWGDDMERRGLGWWRRRRLNFVLLRLGWLLDMHGLAAPHGLLMLVLVHKERHLLHQKSCGRGRCVPPDY